MTVRTFKDSRTNAYFSKCRYETQFYYCVITVFMTYVHWIYLWKLVMVLKYNQQNYTYIFGSNVTVICFECNLKTILETQRYRRAFNTSSIEHWSQGLDQIILSTHRNIQWRMKMFKTVIGQKYAFTIC